MSADAMRIEGTWLVEVVDEHTCGAGPGSGTGMHEPGCGLVPVVDLATLPGWDEHLTATPAPAPSVVSDAAGLGDRIATLSARLAAVGFPACTCHPGDDDSERCLPRPQERRSAEIECAALSSTTITAAPSATRDEVAEALGVVWDDGNGSGLDGWVGPGRGAGEVDHEAVRARDRAVDRALRVIAAVENARITAGLPPRPRAAGR